MVRVRFVTREGGFLSSSPEGGSAFWLWGNEGVTVTVDGCDLKSSFATNLGDWREWSGLRFLVSQARDCGYCRHTRKVEV